MEAPGSEKAPGIDEDVEFQWGTKWSGGRLAAIGMPISQKRG